MIKPPSLQREFTIIWSKDPALVPPPETPDENADEAALAAYKLALTDYERRLKVARETGEWAPMVREGHAPTAFHFMGLDREEGSWLYGESEYSSIHKRPLTRPEQFNLIVRIGIRGIDNFGDYSGRVVRNHLPNGGPLACSHDIINAIYAATDADCINEFAVELARRLHGAGPLS